MFVDTLLEEIPEDNGSGVVITVKAESAPSSPQPTTKQAQGIVEYDPALVYLLEYCTVLALRDEQTVELLGKRVADALQTVLRDVNNYHANVVGRVTFYLFCLLRASYVRCAGPSVDRVHMLTGLKEHDFVRAPVLLHGISSFSKDNLRKSSRFVLEGILLCIAEPGRLRSETMTSPDFWAILRTLAQHEDSAPTVFAILEKGASGSPPAILADNYEAAIKLMNQFATAASVGAPAEQQRLAKGQRKPARPAKHEKPSENVIVQRGLRALQLIDSMTSRIPHLMKQSHLESDQGACRDCDTSTVRVANSATAWSAYWLPIFEALAKQCTNPCREVRHMAFGSLQRSLLSPDLTSGTDHKEWTAIFDEVLFPLIKQLLKPEVYSSDRDGMSETRDRAASLLCKTFLQYLVLLSGWEGMLQLWLEIIGIMDRLMNSGQGDSLVRFGPVLFASLQDHPPKGTLVTDRRQEEAVPENLKNVLLFMASSGYLVPPSREPSKEELWVETWKRIDRFLPDLKKELALDEEEKVAAEEEKAAPAPSVAAVAGTEPAEEKKGDDA